MVWTLVEPGVAIVAASLVTVRPLLRLLRLRGFHSTGQTPYAYGPARSGAQSTTRRPDHKAAALDSVITASGKSSFNRTAPLPPLHSSADDSTAPPFISPLTMSPFNLPSTDRYDENPHFFDGHVLQPVRPPAVLPSPPENVVPSSRARNQVRSEMYIIEGARIDDEPTRNSFPSPSTSSIELEGLEAHSQDSGRVGLGAGSRKR